MKTLIVEDDVSSRLVLQGILKTYGDVHVAVDGRQGLAAVRDALASGQPYDLVCLDIMMPEMDGHQTLQSIRDLEKQAGVRGPKEVKVLMTTALADAKNVVRAFYEGGATSYLVKPVDKANVIDQLQILGLPPG